MVYFRGQVTRFVMIFQGRSGSTFLTTALDSHPHIRARGEILVGVQNQGAEAQIQAARDCLTPPLIGHQAVVGFKTKLMDVLDPYGFSVVLEQKQAKVISLLRRNRVKLVVSWINSERLHEARGKWQSYTDEDRPAVPFRIEPADFECRLETLEELRRHIEVFVRDLEVPTLSLSYEELLVDGEEAFNRVFRFLGVEPQPVEARCIKTTSDDLRDVIENFAELRSCYSGTLYEPMFDEVLVEEQPRM